MPNPPLFPSWQIFTGDSLSPPDTELHVWQANIEISEHEADKNYTLLSDDEKQRADRFKFRKHALHFIAARSMLRKILSHYLHISPEKIVFAYSEQGKPAIAHPIPQKPIFFNLSHSHGIALYAIVSTPEIGIDIEYKDESLAFLQIAKRFFGENEAALLASFPNSQKADIFFKIWTAKEAFIKALGKGLAFPLTDFEVTIEDSDIRLKSILGDQNEAQKWRLFSLPFSPQYMATAAIKPQKFTLKLWKIP